MRPRWKPRNAKEKAAADRAVAFFTQYLRHTKGKWAGVPFSLLPWQEHEVIRPIFGTLRPDGARQIKMAWVEVAKKSGKSEIGAGIALQGLFADDEPMAEVYSVARDRDQASIVFNVAARMVEKSPALNKRARVIRSTKRIIVTKGVCEGSFYQALAADSDSADGVNPSRIIYDEVHRARNRELWDVLNDSMVARAQGLLFAITTAGYDRESLAWQEHEYARKVLEGIIEDPSFLAVIYAADAEDDFRDPAAWKKASPSLGITVPIEYYAEKAKRAVEEPAYENTFRRFFLNQWVAQESRWMPMVAWDKSAGPVDARALEAQLQNGGCFAALDLSQTRDLTALHLIFPPYDDPMSGPFRSLSWFWMPEENIAARVRSDQAPYDVWAREGWIRATPGNTVDYETVERDIRKIGMQFAVREIAFDPAYAHMLSQRLAGAGYVMIPIRQAFETMSSPTADLLQLVKDGRFRHGGNPVLRWMADNVVVEQDASGRWRPSKRKSTKRIDGIVAGIMALDRAERHLYGDQDDGDDLLVYDDPVTIGPNY